MSWNFVALFDRQRTFFRCIWGLMKYSAMGYAISVTLRPARDSAQQQQPQHARRRRSVSQRRTHRLFGVLTAPQVPRGGCQAPQQLQDAACQRDAGKTPALYPPPPVTRPDSRAPRTSTAPCRRYATALFTFPAGAGRTRLLQTTRRSRNHACVESLCCCGSVVTVPRR